MIGSDFCLVDLRRIWKGLIKYFLVLRKGGGGIGITPEFSFLNKTFLFLVRLGCSGKDGAPRSIPAINLGENTSQ